MKNHVRKALTLLLAATMAVSMTACGGGKKDDGAAEPKEDAVATTEESTQESAGGYKDTIVWGQGADVTSMDPHQGKETPAVQVTNNIFDTLTIVNPETNEVEPQIAESWEQTDDKTYVFKIRQGIKFHDGSDLTAEDVKFSLERAINSAAVSYVVDFIDTIEVNDEYTVTITTDAHRLLETWQYRLPPSFRRQLWKLTKKASRPIRLVPAHTNSLSGNRVTL